MDPMVSGEGRVSDKEGHGRSWKSEMSGEQIRFFQTLLINLRIAGGIEKDGLHKQTDEP